MIVSGKLLLLGVLMFSGCSLINPDTKINTYDLRSQHYNIKISHELSINKLDEIRSIENTGIELNHNSLWYYGLDQNLNKDQIFLIESNEEGYFKFDFGFEKFSKIYTKRFFGDFNDHLINKSKFKTFNNLFNYIYIRLTELNEEEYIDFISNLHKEKIINIDKYNSLDIDKYISEYFGAKYLDTSSYFYDSNKKVKIDENDFIPYIYTMYIVYNILEKNSLELINDI